MLRNLLNRHDVVTVREQTTSEGVTSIARRFGKSSAARVREAWHAEPGHDQWWVVDAVRRRWREKVSSWWRSGTGKRPGRARERVRMMASASRGRRPTLCGLAV